MKKTLISLLLIALGALGYNAASDTFGANYQTQSLNVIGTQASYEVITGGWGGAGSASSSPINIDGIDGFRVWTAFRPTNNSTGTIAFKIELSEDTTYWYPLNVSATSTNLLATSTLLSVPFNISIPFVGDGSNKEATTTFMIADDLVNGAKFMRLFARYLDTDGDNNEDGVIWTKVTPLEGVVR